jgi:hypothetical protein
VVGAVLIRMPTSILLVHTPTRIRPGRRPIRGIQNHCDTVAILFLFSNNCLNID